MSLTKQFKSLTETKILLTEVSKAKRKVQLLKVAKYIHKERDENELYRRVVRFIEDFPIVVERTYGELDKLKKARYGVEFPDIIMDFYKERFDIEEIIKEPYLDLTSDYQHEKWWGLIALIGVVKLFKDLEEVDPTGNMKYGDFLTDGVLRYTINSGKFGNLSRNNPTFNTKVIMEKEGIFYEDLPKLKAYLEYYHEMKQKNELPDEYKDINKVVDEFNKNHPDAGIKSPTHVLNHITKEFRTTIEGSYFEIVEAKLQEGKDYNTLYDGDKFIAYKPITQKAKSVLGMNSEWCTTYGEHCLNPDYQDREPYDYEDLYIFINKDNPDEKYQYDHETLMFMDQDDRSVDKLAFFDEHHELGKVIIENEDDVLYPYNTIPDSIWDRRGEDKEYFKKDDKGYYLEYESFKDLALNYMDEEQYEKYVMEKGEKYIEDILDAHFNSPSGFIYKNDKVKIYLGEKFAVLRILMYNEIVDEDMTILQPEL